MIWNNSLITYDYRVAEQTGWRDLYNYTTFQARAGVYIFANSALQVKYVGKAGPGRMVVEMHDALFNRNKGYGASQVKVLYTNSNDYAWSLETELKNHYDPPNNLT